MVDLGQTNREMPIVMHNAEFTITIDEVVSNQSVLQSGQYAVTFNDVV